MKWILAILISSLVLIAGCTNAKTSTTTTIFTDPEQCEGGKMATCPDGNQYDRWNVVDGKCVQIQYFRDPCGELPSGGRLIELAPEACREAGGNWNECGSPCAGTGSDFCIQVCQAQCECGGIAGFSCPAGYECRLSGKIADEIGVCIPKANV